ncbi:hypothetical protein LMH87_006020 [Akanthomyces muscarius]|uniref:C2H2-type domain-containing protein n=1 Tax=Akanthomyces muscarius TaxID=2231603 RepID=A0A9W8QLW9_AKAMU|nr:hypothetical protein LMH87_006020 [Akanthomyces muscarius]KAJ4164343.1 hypothetical protein LMH87_006020 [Akanthomyces muscarius]
MSWELDTQDINELFRVIGRSQRRSPGSGPRVAAKWERQYGTIVRLAAAHVVSREEFECLLTIASPHTNGRVFYPFHVTTRAQAEAMLWDWYHNELVAHRMLKTMRVSCNRHAEGQGLGEADMTPEILVFWMVAHFCRVIVGIKASHPEWTQDNILWFHGDRQHRPIVPWVQNILCASLCKGPDHGIAMKFGITEGVPPTEFDPVTHINMGLCTVTIDTIATNVAMWNYEAKSWPSVLEYVASVPVHHPLWRIDEAAGLGIWRGATYAGVTPIMPAAEFDMGPLVPIGAWFADAPLRPQCHLCGTNFTSIGVLVQHCHARHPIGDTPAHNVRQNTAGQDAMEAEYWVNTLQCLESGCDNTKVYATKYDLAEHKRLHAGGELPCKWPECGQIFSHHELLSKHMRIHEETHKCTTDVCLRARV